MAGTLSPDNAIAWAQVRLRGGWKNLAITGFGYAILVGGGIYSSAKLLASSPAAAYGGWLTGLLGLQSAVLLLFGASRIGGAIRQDHASRMIESHRLMPIGAGQAVLGYIAGSASQAIVLAGVNLALGAMVAVGAGLPVSLWMIANFVLAAFCAFVWVLSAFWAFLFKVPFAMFLLLVVGSWLSHGLLIELVPALTALAGPLMGQTVFSFRMSATEPSFAYAVSFCAQVFIGTICFIGAARRFRRGDRPGFTLAMSLLMLAGWVAISCVTIRWWDDFKPAFLPGQMVNTDSQLMGSLLSSMLLALIPIAGSARAQCEWGRVPHNPRHSTRPLPFLAVALAATLIVLCLTCVELPAGAVTVELLDRVLGTASVVFLFLLSAGYLLQVLIRCGINPLSPMLIWLALFWLGPLLADVVRRNVFEDDLSNPILMTVSTCSPLGALLQIWSPPGGANPARVNTMLGIAVQALVAVIFFLLDARTKRTRRET